MDHRDERLGGELAEVELAEVELVEVELVEARIELARPFVTGQATRTHKDVLIVRVRTRDGVDGWGECSAEATPTYAPEYVDGALAVTRDHLVPRLFAGRNIDEVAGHRMAKAALRMALLDAELRARHQSLAEHLGAARSRVPVGVVVERYNDPHQTADVAAAHVAEGYPRIKLKIAPGFDIDHIDAVRRHVGSSVALWADANGGYAIDDVERIAELDVDLIEQPLRAGDLLDHAALRSRISATVCLDESISSTDDAKLALHLGAAGALAIKAGRVGGIEAAVAIHDLCRAAGVDAWVGGMLETGIGRAANLALSALPGFTLPGDISATRRYFAADITEPFCLDSDGMIAVPTGPGLGITVDRSALDRVAIRRELLTKP